MNLLPDHQLELCVHLYWRTLGDRHDMPSEVRQALIGAGIWQTGEVSMAMLDVDQPKNMRDAMAREIQSWLKFFAVKAGLRSQFATKDAMKIGWMLRFKESEQAKSRLVIMGH